MKKGSPLALIAISLVLAFGDTVRAEQGAFEYPCYLLDAYDADDSCWTGMDAHGRYKGPIRVIPERWLVGPPLSEKSAVTLPADHWVEVQFRGPIVDGPGDDIVLIELGPVSEQALVFVTDGAGEEYLLSIAEAGSIGAGVDPTEIGFDIAGVALPFAPRAVRIVGLDHGGESPGFDVASVQARISNNCGEIPCNPVPVDGAVNVPADAVLSWLPAGSAEKHVLHLSTDIADLSGTGRVLDANSFDPSGLELGSTYYWRVDEVNDPGVWPGAVWSFTTANRLVVDDFEAYDEIVDPSNLDSKTIYDAWKNANVYISTEQTHECSKKSMAFGYYYYSNSVYSEAIHAFKPAQDWAKTGVKVLELFFFGQPYNSKGQMYMVFNDGNSETIVPYPGDANDLRTETWQLWRVELSNLRDLDMSNIESFSIGFSTAQADPYGMGSGTVYFDDITLYSSRCLQENRPLADLNGDCAVNFPDIEELTRIWLDRGRNTCAVAAPNAPVAWYKFDGNVDDSAGSAHGLLHGNPTFAPGVHGQAISFDGYEDSVELTRVTNLFSAITYGMTIALWQYGADSPHLTDTLCCSNYVYGNSDPAIAVNLGCWRRPGQYNWDCGQSRSFHDRLSGHHRYESEWSGRWNHWAFTKDVRSGQMQIFLNGRLYDSRAGADSPISRITSFEIGSGFYGGYDGLIDDFQIYDYALSQSEIAHAATNGTGVFDLPLMLPGDLNNDNRINFADFALLGDNWLENGLWP
ncbi:MAG: LamG domain-containing protein [Phycisphaerae bacterium]|nr:LamG domain-containing protein [Phycisphaerae bacterium]